MPSSSLKNGQHVEGMDQRGVTVTSGKTRCLLVVRRRRMHIVQQLGQPPQKQQHDNETQPFSRQRPDLYDYTPGKKKDDDKHGREKVIHTERSFRHEVRVWMRLVTGSGR